MQKLDSKEKIMPYCDDCRTQPVSAEFSSCLTEQKKQRCTYACLCVDGYLCTHPDHREFNDRVSPNRYEPRADPSL